jgi:hypothetical protein
VQPSRERRVVGTGLDHTNGRISLT